MAVLPTGGSIGGWIFVCSALFYFVFKAAMAFDAARDPGSSGGAPLLDGVIFPPLCGTVGVFFLHAAPRNTWGFPAYALLWLLLTVAAGVVFALADRAGAYFRRGK